MRGLASFTVRRPELQKSSSGAPGTQIRNSQKRILEQFWGERSVKIPLRPSNPGGALSFFFFSSLFFALKGGPLGSGR